MASSQVHVTSDGSVDWRVQPAFVVLVPAPDKKGDDPFARLVNVPVVRLIADLRALEECRQDGTTATTRIAVVVRPLERDQPPELDEALFEAARGIVESLTVELASSGLRLNVVRGDETQDLDDFFDFLRTQSADFVAGASMDARG